MHEISISHPGPPHVLRWAPAASPIAQPGEIVIDVIAAALNNADLLQRQGMYPVPSDAPRVLGLEASGIVSQVGENVTRWEIGDEVCALLLGGGYSERVAVPDDMVLPKPDSINLLEAAALPEALATVVSNLDMTAHLSRGHSILIQGGGGGIGTTAIQFAKAVGAHVITTVGSDGKKPGCYGLGADRVVNYITEDFVEAVFDETDGDGVDVILDVVGGDYFARHLHALGMDGHLVIIGNAGDTSQPNLPLGVLMGKRASVSATMLRNRPHRQKARIIQRVHELTWPMIAAGHVRPVIDSVIPMRDAALAHEHLNSGNAFGKVLLVTPAGEELL